MIGVQRFVGRLLHLNPKMAKLRNELESSVEHPSAEIRRSAIRIVLFGLEFLFCFFILLLFIPRS